ncbi:CRISPR-associated endonuclease Cas2 [Propionivibrio sp.]|uniref:CRISPR-associated endonuclease Cas2 n=1 Tax=Propionivibrio sp. TaxID=2212460 RepID=UPI002615110F|nr:CRISPR-associated endonuclease Cas2 [Propionivibrio sp.]
MLIIVCYDVNTETREGRRRLRRVAKVCEGSGQRVQKSVFECKVDLMQLEELERRLLAEINTEHDCLRLYRLAESRGCEVREYGRFRALDFDAPLVA